MTRLAELVSGGFFIALLWYNYFKFMLYIKEKVYEL